MRKLILIGSGFHSKIVYEEILKLKKYKVLGYISNDDKKKHSIYSLIRRVKINGFALFYKVFHILTTGRRNIEK